LNDPIITGPKAPLFLDGENPAHARYREATELFALFDYLRAQRFGVFSIRESLQAVGERRDGTLQGFHLSADETWACIEYMDSLGVGVAELPAYPANEYGQAVNRDLHGRARAHGLAIELAAHARCVPGDVRAAYEAGFRRLHLYIGTSKIKQATARATVAELAEKAFEAIELARELGAICVRISTEDAFRTTLDDYETFYVRLQALLAARGIGVEGIGIPDTV
jgi:isopropylmalate/homocitrate/citramalate synthase